MLRRFNKVQEHLKIGQIMSCICHFFIFLQARKSEHFFTSRCWTIIFHLTEIRYWKSCLRDLKNHNNYFFAFCNKWLILIRRSVTLSLRKCLLQIVSVSKSYIYLWGLPIHNTKKNIHGKVCWIWHYFCYFPAGEFTPHISSVSINQSVLSSGDCSNSTLKIYVIY